MDLLRRLAQHGAASAGSTCCFNGSRIALPELHTAARTLAASLRALGVTPGSETAVLLALPRTPALVMAHLAVFLAGGVIVPVDPGIPAHRLTDILADARPAVAIVGTPEQADLLAAHCRVIQLAQVPSLTDTVSAGDLPWERAPHEAAYVIYTSGTTGKPKGVVVELQSLEALLQWHLNAFDLTGASCVSLTASPGFDASVWEIWAALAAGSSMQTCTDDERLDPFRLQKAWLEHGVTHAFVSTPLAERLLEQDWSAPGYTTRFVLTGGDRLTRRPPAGLPFQLINNYGPSETTVVATSGLVQPLAAGNAGVAPDIGTGLPHARTYILGEDLLPVPKGEQGLLWVGGAAVARGYLHQPELTEERFRPDPFATEPGARMYLTGDIVSENADGALVYHGRNDFQAKVDGVRIELAEVENVLCQHARVAQAAALVVTLPATGARRLVCTVVPRGEAPSGEELRAHMEQRVPRAMVPVQYLTVEMLPLTANGKVDRAALERAHAAELAARRAKRIEHVPEADMPESLRAVRQIWSEVLEQAVEPDSEFYGLGGSSLAAALIASRISRRLDRDCRVSHVLGAHTPAALAAVLETLPPLGQAETHAPAAGAGDGWFPATAMQQGLWYLWQTNPQNPFYNIGAAFELAGQIDAAKLQQAVLQAVTDAPALTTRFRQNPDSLRLEQKTEALSAAELLPHVVFSTPAADRETARAQAEDALRQPFDLEQGPLFRSLYVPTRQGRHLFLLACHHIVADGLSLRLLLDRIARNYAALAAGTAPESGEAHAHYARYVAWQEQRSQRPEAVAYWTGKAGELRTCEFPADGEPPEEETFSGAILACESPAGLGTRLDAYCREHQVSRFVVMLAAWSTVLAQFCHQEELAIGVPFHGRTHPAFEGDVGMFVNVVPVAMQVLPGQSFADLVRSVGAELERAMEYGDVSTPQIAGFTRRVGGGVNLVNATFSEKLLLSFPLQGADPTFIELDTGGARFGLSGFFSVVDGRIAGHVEYATPLFNPATVAQIVQVYFEFLARALAQHEGTHDLCLPQGEVMLADADQVSAWVDRALPLHHLFEQSVRQHPHEPALIANGVRWTYTELNGHADTLAAFLRQEGVQPGELVPLIMERSPHMVAAILAVLKLGAVYVPLDPENPLERNAGLLHSLTPRLVVTGEDEPSPEGPWKVCAATAVLRGGAGTVLPEPLSEVPVTAPAYLLFTSGSTGTPKGVMCPHLGASLRVMWQVREGHIRPGERVLFKTPYTFDVSVWELFYPLASGAALVIAPPGLQRDPIGLARLIETESIRLCHFVPTMLQAFVEAVEGAEGVDLSSLRFVHTSGEALPTRLARRLLRCLPQVQVLNLYGPTETGIEVTCYDSAAQPDRVNLGHLLPYVTAIVADRHDRPVPKGFPGQLLLGGPSLALDYFRNAAETERAFFTANVGGTVQRFYRTGDLVRESADGTLDYLGRMDAQLKVRGVRVEAGEIEAAIGEVAGVQEAVVVLGRADSGAKTLVCFYVPATPGGEAAAPAMAQRIKGELGKKLPDALIPALYVPVSSLPVTRSGKRDRRSLAETASAHLLQHQKEQGRRAETPRERSIAAAWCTVLHRPEVGADQNFFELGGDSVRALQIVNLLRRDGLKLSIRDFFRCPTVAELAAFLENGGQSEQASGRRARAAAPAEKSLPLTPLQSVMLVETLKNPQADTYWQVLAYSMPTGLRGEAVQQAWQATVRANPALRTRIVWQDGMPGQVIANTAGAELICCSHADSPVNGRSLADWCTAEVEALRAQSLLTLQKVFFIPDWASAPGAPRQSLFVWIHHHILVDGWSLVQCLQDFFGALLNQGAPLPERPSLEAYFTWVEETGAQAAARQFWAAELDGVQGAETLAFEKPAPQPGTQPDFLTQDGTFSVQAARTLTSFCQRHGVTPTSVITYLWALLLRQYQERDEICVGMTFANRPPELACAQELSGMLINTLPVRVRFAPEQSFVDGCAQVLDTILETVEHTGIPYADLLQTAGLPGMTELFKSTLVFQNFAGHLDQTPAADAAWTPRLVEARGTSTDPLSLTLDVREATIATRLGWDARLYDGDKVAAILRALEYWLERLDALEAAPTDRISLVTPAERQVLDQALRPRLAVNDATPRWSIGQFLRGGQDSAIAVSDGVRTLTYSDLRQRATRLASYLTTTGGVNRGSTVAYIGKRSAECVIAMTAAWLCGAAWCALDPDFPAETQQRTLQALKPAAVVRLADIWQLTGQESFPVDETLLDTTLAPEELAYFISTSGSTGTPKLVALSAGGLIQVVSAWKAYYGLDAEPQRVLQIGSFTSDVFLGDFLKAVSTGGSLVICPDSRRVDMAHLEELLRQWRITLVESTPALISALVGHLTRSSVRPAALKTIIVGSDIFRIKEAHALAQQLWSGVRLFNGYGLSECTIESVVYSFRPEESVTSRSGLCPLGLPLPGTFLRITDTRGQDVPPGAVGELHIGGRQASMGYLTADGQMLTDRFYTRGDTRYFRTGDLVRLNEAGQLEFFGRRDNQVKVRGYRVELGEIENALLRYPRVQEATVIPDGLGADLELVAFFSGAPDLDEFAVQNWLRQHIPAHAVPHRYVKLPQLPRNANGKVDRVKLKARAATVRAEQPVQVPVSRTVAGDGAEVLRQTLTEIWQGLLNRPVRTDRSFFDQGGHSLMVLRLHEQIREQIPGADVGVADLFRCASIDALVAELVSRQAPRPAVKPAPGGVNQNRRLEILQLVARSEITLEQAVMFLQASPGTGGLSG